MNDKLYTIYNIKSNISLDDGRVIPSFDLSTSVRLPTIAEEANE